MKEVRIIKGFQSQLKNAEADYQILKTEIYNKQKELNQKKQQIQSIKEKIKVLESESGIKISEHAIIRYLERVNGLDIDKIQKDILSDEMIHIINTLGGNGTFPNKDFKVVLKDYTVTTII